jgi:hypothetical protein
MHMLLLSLALVAAEADLRLFNPQVTAVDVNLCGAVIRIEPNGIADIAACETVVLDPRLVTFEATESEQRLLIETENECGPAAMRVPLFACANANASASVAFTEGATYAWTAEGATILSGAGTNQVALLIGDVATAKVSCVITTTSCSSTATGIIAVRPPLVIRNLKASADAEASKPVTITWSYDAGSEPASQLLTGSAFSTPVPLSGDARSYTFTPEAGGTQSIELRASYARSVSTVTRTRRRAAGATLDPIPICPSARAAVDVDIRGCAFRPKINTVDDVIAEGSFSASIVLGAKDTAEWSVTNGAILNTSDSGDRIAVRAGASGVTLVSVRVTSGSCNATAEARVPTYQKQCSAPPSASLAFVSQDCVRAIVRATFTGAPPFAGTWSDRSTFRTTSTSVVHDFSSAGTYRITDLHDANCLGSSQSSVSVATLKPSVTLTNEGSCDVGKLVARFNGAPPFNGHWSDGVKFTTSDSEIRRTVGPGVWSIAGVTDSNCRNEPVGSASVTIAAPPRLVVPAEPSCDFGSGSHVEVRFESGEPAYRVEWTDGLIATSVSPKLSRSINSYGANRSIEVRSATASGCAATISNRLTNVIYREPFWITGSQQTMCVGDTGVFRASKFPAGAKVTWEFRPAMWATMLSGQGTEEVSFQANRSGYNSVQATARYPDGFCENVTWSQANVTDPGSIQQYRIKNSRITVGTYTILSFEPVNVLSYQLYEKTYRNYYDVRCWDGICSANASWPVPTKLVFELRWTDCRGSHVEPLREVTVE